MIWLLLDRSLHIELRPRLETRGIRCIHAAEEGFAAAPPQRIFEAAIEDECVLVTASYADFAALAEAYRAAGRGFPGVLFMPSQLIGWELEGQVEAIERWLEGGGPEGGASRCQWLSAGTRAGAGQAHS